VVAARLALEPASDPAAGLVRSARPPMRQADLDRLFAALADAPEDDAARVVLIDLLEEAGEPYAPQLAVLLGGEASPDLQYEVLGPLARYIDRIEHRRGLPWSGTLSKTAPLDDEIGDLVAMDQRLGFFHTLRLDGDGDHRVYAKLVASPRAVGLRHVDISRSQIVTALIAGRRRDLTRLSSVRFATREVIEGLADSTFDRVQELETETSGPAVAKLLEFIARDETRFFARSPRSVILVERAGAGDALVSHVLAAWSRLPVARLTVAGIALSRDGTAVAARDASEAALAQVRARFAVSRAS
jgi:hypothetical protein